MKPTRLARTLGAALVFVVGSCGESSTAVPLVSQGGPWPDNEPSGLVPVYPGHPSVPGILIDGSHYRFDYRGAGGSDLGSAFSFGAKWDGGPRILSTTEPGSRYASVLRRNTFVGDGSGWQGLANDDEFAADYETLYFRMIFKFSANWQAHSSVDKLWYWGEANSGGSDFYVGIINGDIVLQNQSGSGPDQGQWRSSMEVSNDVWHTLEIIQHAQSALGVPDGSFRAFFDDVEITPWTWLGGGDDPDEDAIEWYSSGNSTRLFSGIQLFLYWGGSNDTKSVDDHVDISELYITGKPASN